MSLSQLKNCSFGTPRSNATGSAGVGYTLLDTAGSIVSARTVTGVYQLTSSSGVYAANVSFPDDFHGQILWDTGTAFASTYYAAEEYNVEANNPNVDATLSMLTAVSGSVVALYDINYGRWRIDKVTNQMVFYKADNATVVATFDLFDDAGAAAFDSVFERRKV